MFPFASILVSFLVALVSDLVSSLVLPLANDDREAMPPESDNFLSVWSIANGYAGLRDNEPQL